MIKQSAEWNRNYFHFSPCTEPWDLTPQYLLGKTLPKCGSNEVKSTRQGGNKIECLTSLTSHHRQQHAAVPSFDHIKNPCSLRDVIAQVSVVSGQPPWGDVNPGRFDSLGRHLADHLLPTSF